MRLLLIRHGETVDNVAGLYAGSRDSPLTSHGLLQAHRLATHLAAETTPLRHVFSSNLDRAIRTAEALAAEQKRLHQVDVAVVPLASLREKHFGSDEGVKFGDKKGVDAETVESMRARVNDFLDRHLGPLLAIESAQTLSLTCAVVAHGVILDVLYRLLCSRARQAVDGSAFPSAFWSNTGYLECALSICMTGGRGHSAPCWSLHVNKVNCVSHLKDLKKTRGGIGSAAHDPRQQRLTSFFPTAHKRRNAGRED